MSRPFLRFLRNIAIAVTLVGAVTAVLAFLDARLSIGNVTVAYLIPVVVAATWLGLPAAVVAAIGGVGASAYYFYAPIYDFRVADPAQLIDLPFFILVAAVIWQLSSSLKRQAGLARRREAEMRALHAFSRRLSRARTEAELDTAVLGYLSERLGREVKLVPVRRLNTSPEAAAQWLVRSLSTTIADAPSVAVRLLLEDQLPIRRDQAEAALVEAMATLSGLDIGRALSDARARSELDLLRGALIGALTHELKTPLASILGSVSVLAATPAVAGDPRTLELAGGIRSEAVRLNDDIQNLIDATRIGADEMRTVAQWTDPGDLIDAALSRKRDRLAGHAVKVEVPQDLPLVHVDPQLVAQALGQLVENAAKYSPAGSPVTIAARARGGEVDIVVIDQGLGLGTDEIGRLWDRFYRSPRLQAGTPGSGLGLWIARAFVEASGGRMAAASPGPGSGATFTMTLPAPSPGAIPETAA